MIFFIFFPVKSCFYEPLLLNYSRSMNVISTVFDLQFEHREKNVEITFIDPFLDLDSLTHYNDYIFII